MIVFISKDNTKHHKIIYYNEYSSLCSYVVGNYEKDQNNAYE